MPSADDMREAAALLGRHFGLPEAIESAEPPPLGTFPHHLARRVLELLHGDLGQLTNILYRLDVSEDRVRQAFEAEALEDVAADLAELTIARGLKTVEQRRALDESGET